jgi:hypothetical protein
VSNVKKVKSLEIREAFTSSLFKLTKSNFKPGVVQYTYKTSTPEVEEGGL